MSRAEPMPGAGAAARHYVLLHWPRAHWRVPRIASFGMPEDLSAAIIAAHEAGLHVALVEGDQIALSSGAEVLPAASPSEAAAAILRLARGGALAEAGQLHHDPRITIMCCTDGKMDPCCARYGFATWKALRAAADPARFRVLQSTHIGGCRFAASLLVLPERARYGRLEPAQVPDFLAALALGQPYLPAWRGDARLDPAAQVADHAARAYAATRGETLATPPEAVFTDDAGAVFHAALPSGRVEIRLHEADFAVNTRCRTMTGDAPPETARHWLLSSLVPLGGVGGSG
ncbi:sucrase ferredoxin [Pseudogemmobacter hezensis]|uniref:sucrase ferredoxin n=1 Tax=Pseudogemmobacter hezensis TaxID=2737662 RepID=UPI001C131133|nr:sucrase ferredoxin [Pseudogemmobacter hezensis]